MPSTQPLSRLRISLDALRFNARALARLIAPAKAAFVVKSNAYGHGLVPVAQALAPLADRLCVYSLHDAVALREAGISQTILVMGPIDSGDLEEAFARDVEIALWDTASYARAVSCAASKRGGRFRVHVKIDTGVARLGLQPAVAADAIARYARTPELQVAGIFSHLAAAEELDSTFTQRQIHAFETVLRAAAFSMREPDVRPLRHIAASAAAMLWPRTRLDMARFGIAAYGLWPSPQTRNAMRHVDLELQPALSFTARLAAVRCVEEGSPIGYGCTYRAPKAARIGTVPVGYADGIPRSLSNCGAFAVAGARCPIVGRVCMNMTMIDLEQAPNAQPGDTVTLIGTDGATSVSVEDWARWAGTINYEIVARLPQHLPRVMDDTDACRQR